MEASSHRRSGLMTEEIFLSIACSASWLMTSRQEAEHPVRGHGFLLVGPRANKERGSGVCEANGFRYRYPAGEVSGQGADKCIGQGVGIDQFHRMSGFCIRSSPAFGHR